MKQIHFKCGQLCRWNPARGFEFDGKPIHIVDTNYVARYICTNFWEDWRPEVIEADLSEIAAAGLNAVRIPVHWEHFEPAPGQYREEALERFGKFLDMAATYGLFVMP
ncbi:MAG: beta-galactosidase [Candidatus Latescibacteria bacterium]|nr:beta-galactosidase [Candidatus Latescibacterota bacterium]